MCDKYNFRKLVTFGASVSIYPVISKDNGQYVLLDPGPMRGIDPEEDVLQFEKTRGAVKSHINKSGH